MKSALAPSDHAITVQTADGSATHSYHLRSLRVASSDSEEGQEDHDTDVTNWTEFCAGVFSYKSDPPPASYFARHYYNDPRRDPALVRVLVHRPNESEEERTVRRGEIVSSVRIFRRSLSTGPDETSAIEAGGIGEVCTNPNHQRRGLSKILLKDALKIMSTSCERGGEEGGMSCSFLHASPDFRPVYTKAGGYRSVPSEWSSVTVDRGRLSNAKRSGDDEWRVRRANFPEDASSLQRLHAEYSEKRLITVVRSLRYWKEYVGVELGDTLWVLTKPAADGGDTVVAWASIRTRGSRYQLREFGADKSVEDSIRTCWAMRRLLGVALDDVADGNARLDNKVSLLLPTFVLSEMKQEVENADEDDATFLDFDEATDENDDGWMYVQFNESRPNVLEMVTRELNPVPHLIWPTDSF